MMRKNRFQNKVATSGYTLPVAALLSTLLWCAEGVFTSAMLGGWLLCGLTAYLWMETGNANSLVRVRSLLTPATYVAMMGAAYSLHAWQPATVAACAMLASYNLLFRSYQRTDAVSPLFHSFLCLSIGSLFFPQLLFFVPFYLCYAAIYFRSLTWRTFWAAVVGVLLPYWFVAGYELYAGDVGRFVAHFADLVDFQRLQVESYQHLNGFQLGFAIWVILLSLVAAVHCARTSFNDKIRTRMLLRFLMVQELLILAFMALQPARFTVLFALLLMNSAPLLAHYFALTGSRFSNSLFVISLFILCALALSGLWMRLSIF